MGFFFFKQNTAYAVRSSAWSSDVCSSDLWQDGGIPLSEDAIMHALDLNGVAVQTNQEAFRLGRLAASQPQALQPARVDEKAVVIHMPESLDTIVERCRASLVAYQNAAYAQQYPDQIGRASCRERVCQ